MKEIHRIETPRFPYPVLYLLLLFCAGMDKTHAGETPVLLPAAESSEPFSIGCRQVYAGTVGGSAVEMLLGRNRRETGACFENETRTSEPADGKVKLTGYYYYLKTGRIDAESGRRVFEPLALTGQLDEEGNLDLAESVAGRDTPTGRFRGSTSAAGEIKGTWSDVGGKRSLPFSLRKLDGAARNGAVAFCTACAEKAESESCANVIVKIPGEAPLEMGPIFKNEDRYEIDPAAVMNSASVMLLSGRPDLYWIRTFAFADSCFGPNGVLYGQKDYFQDFRLTTLCSVQVIY